jgi:ribonuclease T2
MPAPKSALTCSIAFCLLLGASAPHWGVRDLAGAFDYYGLVLALSPSYCRRDGKKRHDAQCSTSKRHAFTLHGLWPQYEKGWPEECPIGKRPWVPQSVIEDISDIMPSKTLVIHEYRTHGTCSGLEPRQYFSVARELYERIEVPPRFAAPQATHTLSPDEIERAFLDANAWLAPEMMSVTCRGENLLDVRVCFGRDLFPRPCGANEDQQRLCRADRIAVPPVGGH